MFKSGFSIVTDSKCARHPPEIFVQLPLDIPERKVHELLMDCNYLCLSNVWNENHCIDPTILETCIHQIQCESNQTNSVERARERERRFCFSQFKYAINYVGTLLLLLSLMKLCALIIKTFFCIGVSLENAILNPFDISTGSETGLQMFLFFCKSILPFAFMLIVMKQL